MATFEYHALTPDGRLMKGTLEALSPELAGQILTEMRLDVQSLALVPPPPLKSRIGRAELLLFNQQLASIAQAGVPLDRGLRELAGDISKRRMRKLVTSLADDLQDGMSIEDAFAKRQNFFPPLYGKIVKAGVQSGRLGEMLTSLNRHLEMEGQTRRIVIEAVTYPLVVLSIAAVLLTAIFLVVIPPFEKIFEDMGEDLPAITKFFMDTSKQVIPFWLSVGALISGLLIARRGLTLFPAGRRALEGFYFHLPVFGRLYHRSIMSRVSDAMALLVGSGCDLPTAVRLAFSATDNQTFLDQGELLAGRLETGMGVLEAGALCRSVPPLFFYSMQTGAQRNDLQDNLYNLCDMYSQQVRAHQGRLQGLLLPIMLIAIGVVVGMAIIAMFMPMIGLLHSVSH